MEQRYNEPRARSGIPSHIVAPTKPREAVQIPAYSVPNYSEQIALREPGIPSHVVPPIVQREAYQIPKYAVPTYSGISQNDGVSNIPSHIVTPTPQRDVRTIPSYAARPMEASMRVPSQAVQTHHIETSISVPSQHVVQTPIPTEPNVRSEFPYSQGNTLNPRDIRAIGRPSSAPIRQGTSNIGGDLSTVQSALYHESLERREHESDYVVDRQLSEDQKRIDYVLVHKHAEYSTERMDFIKNKTSDRVRSDSYGTMSKDMERMKFVTALLKESLQVEFETINEYVYTKIHCTFERMCQEAENVKLEMPLKGYVIESMSCKVHRNTDQLINIEYIYAPFIRGKLDMYEGSEDLYSFFRPAIRTLLTYGIMTSIDSGKDHNINSHLQQMLSKGTYCDMFVLHEESVSDPIEINLYRQADRRWKKSRVGPEPITLPSVRLRDDPRKDLDETWSHMMKSQPTDKIRDYYGEKIAFYFAWTRFLSKMLWIPTLVGLVFFSVGVVLYVDGKAAEIYSLIPQSVHLHWQAMLKIIFDNNLTPYLSLFICLWSSVFLDLWKREQSRLAHQWHVNNGEMVVRPRGCSCATGHNVMVVISTTKRFIQMVVSASSLLVMVSLVGIISIGIVLFRVIFSTGNEACRGLTLRRFLPTFAPTSCLFIAGVVSALLNGLLMLILGELYRYIAVKLTEWEKHETEMKHERALILKTFAFEFANWYSTCFYLAFVRELLPRQGPLAATVFGYIYRDACPYTGCMPLLTIYVGCLMTMKPIAKFHRDVLMPNLKSLAKGGKKSKSDETSAGLFHNYLDRERRKQSLTNFLLKEYCDKIILYGYVVLFGASFHLAPLIAVVIHLIDIRIDARRLLWWYRRPLAHTTDTIGTWFTLLRFVNFAGVVVNSCLVAFTSSWGRHYSREKRFLTVIVFENLALVAIFIVSHAIPDEAESITRARKREKYGIFRN